VNCIGLDDLQFLNVSSAITSIVESYYRLLYKPTVVWSSLAVFKQLVEAFLSGN